ncbi:MAG: hypothetical protein ACI8W8_003434, partial [Rhodothermales bacterium]
RGASPLATCRNLCEGFMRSRLGTPTYGSVRGRPPIRGASYSIARAITASQAALARPSDWSSSLFAEIEGCQRLNSSPRSSHSRGDFSGSGSAGSSMTSTANSCVKATFHHHRRRGSQAIKTTSKQCLLPSRDSGEVAAKAPICGVREASWPANGWQTGADMRPGSRGRDPGIASRWPTATRRQHGT